METKQLNIRLVTEFDLLEFQHLLPETKLLNLKEDLDTEIDLLIFPGGEDVSMEYYLDDGTIEQYHNIVHSNKSRDEYEISILREVFKKRLKVKKILGVCRGTQFLNVMFGGTLFPDLGQYDIAHKPMHELRHVEESNLAFFTEVNSLHHQGIRNIGNKSRIDGGRTYPIIIATDLTGYVSEISTWYNDMVLGIQFHPEYYYEQNSDKVKFREFLYSWIQGKTKILK